MAQEELEFLFGPWQKDRRGQDDRQHHPRHQDAKTQQQRSSQSRGPSAATWPETQQRGAAARPKTRRAAHRRTCSAHLTALNSRWRLTSAPWAWRVAAPYWPKIALEKLKNFSYWIKTPFRFSQREMLRERQYYVEKCICIDFPCVYPWIPMVDMLALLKGG